MRARPNSRNSTCRRAQPAMAAATFRKPRRRHTSDRKLANGWFFAAASALVCDQAAAAPILDHLRHQLGVNALTPFGVTTNECLFAILIDETGDSAAGFVGERHGGVPEQVDASPGHT